MVKLRQAGGQLTASRAGAGYDDERLFRFDVVVGAIALIADDRLHVRRVALGETVGVNPDAPPLQLVLEELGRGLIVEAGDDDADDVDVPAPEIVNQLEGVGVVGYAEIGADLFSLDVSRIDAQEDIGLVLELADQAHLDIGVVTGKDAGGMIIVEQLPAEFEVELVVETLDPFEDFFGLFRDVLFVVESVAVPHKVRRSFLSSVVI